MGEIPSSAPSIPPRPADTSAAARVPAQAPGTSTPAAAPAPATPKVTNPDVQATTEGRSDFNPAKPNGPVSLGNEATQGALKFHDALRAAPNGANASVTRTDTVDKGEHPKVPIRGEITNSTTVQGSRTQTVKAGEKGPEVKDSTSTSVSNSTSMKLEVGAGPVTASRTVSGSSSFKVDVDKPVGTQGDVNPHDPDKMPVGSKCTMTGSASVSDTQGIKATTPGKGISANGGVSETRTATGSLSASFEKVNDTTMRVSVGTQEALRTAATLSGQVKLGDKASIGVGLTAERGNSTAHLDTREFPDANPANGISASTTDIAKSTHDLRASLEARYGTIGGKLDLGIANADGTTSVTRNSDGTTRVSNALTFNDKNVTINRTFGADGQEDVSKRRYDLVFSNRSENEAGLYARAFGNADFTNRIQRRGNQDVQMSFTQQDVDKIRQLAAAHPSASAPNSFLSRLAKADDPLKVVMAFQDARHSGGVTDLGALGAYNQKPIPGQAFFRDRQTGQTWQFDKPLVRRDGSKAW